MDYYDEAVSWMELWYFASLLLWQWPKWCYQFPLLHYFVEFHPCHLLISTITLIFFWGCAWPYSWNLTCGQYLGLQHIQPLEQYVITLCLKAFSRSIFPANYWSFNTWLLLTMIFWSLKPLPYPFFCNQYLSPEANACMPIDVTLIMNRQQ